MCEGVKVTANSLFPVFTSEVRLVLLLIILSNLHKTTINFIASKPNTCSINVNLQLIDAGSLREDLECVIMGLQRKFDLCHFLITYYSYHCF